MRNTAEKRDEQMEERQKEGSIGVTPHRMSKGNGSCVRWMKLRGESV